MSEETLLTATGVMRTGKAKPLIVILIIIGVLIMSTFLRKRSSRNAAVTTEQQKELPLEQPRKGPPLPFPFKAGTKRLAKGWKYGKGEQKGKIIHVATGEIYHG